MSESESKLRLRALFEAQRQADLQLFRKNRALMADLILSACAHYSMEPREWLDAGRAGSVFESGDELYRLMAGAPMHREVEEHFICLAMERLRSFALCDPEAFVALDDDAEGDAALVLEGVAVPQA